jgi:hypothetical protein
MTIIENAAGHRATLNWKTGEWDSLNPELQALLRKRPVARYLPPEAIARTAAIIAGGRIIELDPEETSVKEGGI